MITPGDTQPTPAIKSPHKTSTLRIVLGAMAAMLVILLSLFLGAFAGQQSAFQAIESQEAQQLQLSLSEQYEMGLADYQAGRYRVALQRFEYILEKDPTYPGITEQIASVITVLSVTATPTASPIPSPTITMTPTPDLRPIQQRLEQAIEAVITGRLSEAIETLISLRNDDAVFQVTRIDRLLYVALKQRGVQKIFDESNLEGGIYDLALAENFGPLDAEALSARNVARIYLIGSSFWEAYPEQAVYYFAQVASAAPYLRDGSGWTAMERYRGALIQYGDQLGREGEWCQALEQYQLAASIRVDGALQTAYDTAYQSCFESITTETIEPSLTPTVTGTPYLEVTPTDGTYPTATIEPTPADTPVSPTETTEPAPTEPPPGEITPTP